ncbi:MAG: cell division protein FtsZ, partial [Gammaproteobacteria bacterium]
GRHGTLRQQPEVRVVRRSPAEKPDWESLDQPAVRRKRAVGDDITPSRGPQEELLDIPAFLRRQAD